MENSTVTTNPETSVQPGGSLIAAAKIEAMPLPLIQVALIEERHVEYLIEEIWVKNSVGLISGQPGSLKTWFSLELAVAVASGTPALDTFDAESGKVLLFNAEDDPATVTRSRIKAIAQAKGVDFESLDLHLFNVPTFKIDDADMQERIQKTVENERPSFVILDPMANLHSLDEDKASDMKRPLEFLRLLQKNFGCSVLLVCHDKKPAHFLPGQQFRRESQTRGSGVMEGWRDTAMYLDRKDSIVTVKINHRKARSPESFCFKLETEEVDDQLTTAKLEFVPLVQLTVVQKADFKEKIKQAIRESGPDTRSGIAKKIKKRKAYVLGLIKEMLSGSPTELIERDGKTQFPEPAGT